MATDFTNSEQLQFKETKTIQTKLIPFLYSVKFHSNVNNNNMLDVLSAHNTLFWHLTSMIQAYNIDMSNTDIISCTFSAGTAYPSESPEIITTLWDVRVVQSYISLFLVFYYSIYV